MVSQFRLEPFYRHWLRWFIEDTPAARFPSQPPLNSDEAARVRSELETVWGEWALRRKLPVRLGLCEILELTI
jgi:hypothetical protein